MSSIPTIVFVRHGETDWNVEGRLQGQRDIPLNETGRAQARRNGEVMARELPDTAGYAFVASPLWRARETMEIARAAMNLDPKAYEVDPRLIEITFGELEGFTYQDIESSRPGWLKERDANKWEFLPPGGESYRMLSERIVGWAETLVQPVVVVAHGGVGRVLRAHLLGLDRAASVAEDFPQDRVFLWRDGQGAWV